MEMKNMCVLLYQNKLRSVCAQLHQGGPAPAPGNRTLAGVPEEERLCKYCNIHVEDELHSVFYCPLYHEWHQKLFDRCKTVALMWLNDADRRKWFVMTR